MRAMIALCVALAVTPTPTPTSSADDIWSRADGDHVTVADEYRNKAIAPTNAAVQDLIDWMRAPACPIRDAFDVVAVWPCTTAPDPPALVCDDGTEPISPLWSRSRATATSDWTDWQLVDGSWCPAAAGPTPEMVLTELRRQTLPAPTLNVQPDRGWVLVNLGVVVHADPAPATFELTLLGVPVHLTATPATYTWDYGDGHTVTTTDPGRPWPATDIAYDYPILGTYRITLTTTWTATYTLGADPTVHTVPGTATTSTTTDPFTVEERRSRLVAETCDQNPDAPGC